jgi:transposase
MQDAPHIPKDLEAAQALVVELSRAMLDLQESRDGLSRKVTELELSIEKLMQRLYGQKSERVIDDPQQQKLDFGGDEPAGTDEPARDAEAAALEEAQQIVLEYTVRRKLRRKASRNEQLPAHLPRYEVTAPVPESVSHCATHGERVVIGFDTTETLEFERPKLRVRVTKYLKYACPGQPQCGIAQPERIAGLVEGNRFDTSVAVEIATDKYAYHTPLYRQQDQFASSGWCPSRSTLENILQSAEYVVRPLANHYRQQLLTDTVIGCDETRVTLITPRVLPELDDQSERSRRQQEVLKEAIEKGKPSLEARMWAYRGVTLPINVFDFTVARRRYGPDDVLSNFHGTLMADCWSGFQKIEVRSDLRIEFAACWAHARRKIHECLLSHSRQATILLAMMRQLYDIEDRAQDLTAEQRLVLRQVESVPVLNRIRAYLDNAAVAVPRVLPKSDLATAVGYIRNNWDALLVYTTKGSIPIDNNDVEQLMKQVALGRKNWLHIGSPDAGDRAATWMTIISTAVRNDLDVPAYLNDVLKQLLAGSTEYAALRADVWKASHPESVRTYRVEERRNAADRTRLRRAQRRLKAAEYVKPP